MVDRLQGEATMDLQWGCQCGSVTSGRGDDDDDPALNDGWSDEAMCHRWLREVGDEFGRAWKKRV